MSSFRFLSSSLFFATALLGDSARGQAASSTPPPPGAKIEQLDEFVVTAGPDSRSAFDLAQGASILAGDSLRRARQATLGETLAATPGVNSTYYGPGASRPIIRGLGGDRVRMLDNGVGSLDASNVSPDHNVSIEPLLVDRIEVLRGPSTLLYGSSAIGGVVNVIDNRIPSTAPANPVSGRTEVRLDSAANERTGILSLKGGNKAFALQVNGLRTETDDVDIPGYADPSNPADRGTLTNSAISTKNGSVGGTYFWSAGSTGIALSEHDTLYGVPVGEPVAIDLKQRRADFRTEITQPFGVFESARVRFGLADYTHAEVDTSSGLPNTMFKNKAYEGRIELVQRDAGKLSGSVGVQTSRSDFSAAGEEVVTPATLTYNLGLFLLESWKLNPELTLQLGGRYEHQSITLGEVDPLLPAYPGFAAATGEKRSDDGFSLSTGAVYYPAKDYSLGFSLAYSQRIPAPQEAFSNGPHAGTGAYEIGTSGLGNETSVGFDLTLRKRTGFATGSVGFFVNRFNDFIFEQRDAERYFDEDSGDLLPYPVPPGGEFLPIYHFISRDAVFYGGEADVVLHLIDTVADRLHLDLTADYVHARQSTDDEPLPRIPPLRLGAALRFEHGPWSAGASLRHSFRQDRIAPGETETAGYTLAGADLSYRINQSRIEWEIFARGTNLADREARVSTSFLKDVAPLPGRRVVAGVRMTF